MPLLFVPNRGSAQDKPAAPIDKTGAPPDGTKSDSTAEKAAEPAEPTDPWVRAILAAPTMAPAEQFQAAISLFHLKQPDLAKKYLQQLVDAKPIPAVLAQLQRRFGSAIFLTISVDPTLQPVGAQLATAVIDATAKLGQDPKQLSRFVRALGDTALTVRATAARQLVRAGSAAVPILLPALKKPLNTTQQAGAVEVLVALGEDAVDPLIAALRSPDDSLRTAAIAVLATIKSTRCVSDLLPLALVPGSDPATAQVAQGALRQILGDVPSRDEALRFLTRRLDNYLAGSPPGRVNEDDRIATWRWDASRGMPIRDVVDLRDAIIAAVSHVAGQLHQIDPQDKRVQEIHNAAVLEQEQRQAGYDRTIQKASSPVVQKILDAAPDVLVRVLDVAREQRLCGAAIAVLNRLGSTGDSTLLRGTSGQVSSLAAALLDPDRWVRFAAARAIVTIDPQQPYPGSSYLPDVLGYLATSGGNSKVLIGHPKIDVARALATQLATLRFDADIALTGRQFKLLAFASPDYAFMIIDDAISRPTQSELVQTMRRDPRTGELPIGLIVRDLENYRARAVVQSDPLSLVFALPMNDTDMALETRRLLKLAGPFWLPPEQRLAQAIFAMQTLAKWAEDPATHGFYDVMAQQTKIIESFNSQLLTARAARLLGLLATPEAQATLVQFASETTRPLVDRRAAVAAFKQAVSRRHLLLTRAQVLTQYDRYNASANLDRDTQQVLAGILDVIENPNQSGKAGTVKKKGSK